MALTIASLNVNGLAERHKRTQVFESLKSFYFDILFLQETHLANDTQGKAWENDWGGQCVWSPGSNRSSGVAAFVHPKSSVKIIQFHADLAGRVLSVKVEHEQHYFQVINIYAPNNPGERELFFDDLWRFKFPNLDTILVGDFNCIPDVILDKWGGDDGSGNRAISQLHAFTDSLSLEDYYRVSNPNGKIFTWFNASHSIGSRLDRFYTPKTWRSRVINHALTPFTYSDHSLITLKFSHGPRKSRGRGVWKLNTQLLKSESFCSAVESFWTEWQEHKPVFSDPRVWWDAGKLQIKEMAIAHSVTRARENKQTRRRLEQEFRLIMARGDANTATDHTRLTEIKSLLKALDDQVIQGSIVRSREQWIEHGEQPTKYFYQLEQSRQTRNAITALRDGAETVTSDKNILRVCREFYSNLYTAEPVDLECQDWLLNQLDKSLTSEDQAKCEGTLTLSECLEALNQMSTNKAPGADGLPTEFYQRFWGLLGEDLVATLNFSFVHGMLSDSQRQGIIRLLFKKDDPLLLKNWRPISLLNTDYKICTKVLANRLRKVLSVILHEDQTCGVPGRSIFENLFLLRDTLDYVNHKELSAVIISLDQEKAFDRVNHAFLQRILERFNFGPNFRQWVQTVYTDISSSVLNNGWLSSKFSLTRGVRQGCPLSPLLYCLVSETLGQALRRDPHIEGIPIPGSSGKESKVSQYADDTTLILANDFSITRSFNIINIFEKGSGSRLNTQKTEGLWIGSSAGRTSGPVNITWTTDKLKILGVYFGNTNVEHANWDNRIIKLEKRLNRWKQRTLSLKGKALIINSIGASGLWYTATVLPLPEWASTRITKAIYKFLWHDQTELVKRTTCQLPLSCGGLAVVNPGDKSKALKLRWIPYVGDPTYGSKWVFFARYWIGLALSRHVKSWDFLRSNSHPKYIGADPPMHFQHILTALNRLNVELTSLPNYRVKTFYKRLNSPAPQYLPCTGTWERHLHISLPWTTIWSSIYGGLSTNWEADIVWRLAHGVLKTRAYLKHWRRLAVSDSCARCGSVESFSHALCKCTVVPCVWTWVLSFLSKLYSTPVTLSDALILFKQGLPGTDTKSHELSYTFINISLNEIWAARNLATFEHTYLTALEIQHKISFRVRQRIRAAFRFNAQADFIRTWGHKSVFCELTQSKLHFFL